MTDEYLSSWWDSLWSFAGNKLVSINWKEIDSPGKKAERGGQKVIQKSFHGKKEANRGFWQK